MIMSTNVPDIEKFLATGTTPILVPVKPIIAINSNFHLKPCEIENEGTDINGFILHDCEIEVIGVDVRNTNCGGNLCDRQQEHIDKCCCFQMNNRSGNVVISIEVKVNLVNLPDKTSFRSEIRSKWFLEKYILTKPFFGGTRSSQFQSYRVEEKLEKSIVNIIDAINNICLFRIIGWTKRGVVTDISTEQPSGGYNVPDSAQVVSGNIKHHITRIDPMKPQLIDIDALETLKFDVVSDLSS